MPKRIQCLECMEEFPVEEAIVVTDDEIRCPFCGEELDEGEDDGDEEDEDGSE